MRLHRLPSALMVLGIFTFASTLLLAQGQGQGQAPAGQAPAAQVPTDQAAPAPVPGTVIGTPANDTAKGAALLAEARKALGGVDKFAAIERLEVKGKGARAQGNSNLQGDFEIALDLPDRFRRKEVLGFNDIRIEIIQVLDGQDGSQKTNFSSGGGGNFGFDGDGGGGGGGGGNRGRGGRGGNDMARMFGAVSEDPEQQKKAVSAELGRFAMLWLLTAKDPVAWIGSAESPDGRADVLEFTTPDGTVTRLLLDEKTHLPLMISWTGVAQQFGNRGGGNRGGGNRGGGNRGGGTRGGGGLVATQATLQTYVSDYKAVNGVKFPHLIQSGANGETTEELVVKSVKVNPSFKADFFKP